MENNSIEKASTSNHSVTELTPSATEIPPADELDQLHTVPLETTPLPIGPYPSGHQLLEASPPEEHRKTTFVPPAAPPKPSSTNWTGWAILVILLFGVGYWVAFKSSLLIPYYVGVSNIEWYTPFEKNQSEMVQPIYEEDGRSAIYQRKNEKFIVGTVKPTSVFYKYKDNYLISGKIFFEKLEDFESAKKYLDFLYTTHEDKLEKENEGEKSKKFRIWWGNNHYIVEDHFEKDGYYSPKGHYLIFYPQKSYLKVPESLNKEKNFPKVATTFVTSTTFKEDQSSIDSNPLWSEFRKKFYTPGLTFIPSKDITNKFNELYGVELTDGKYSKDSFKNVSKSVNAKYGIYTNIGSGRSWTTLGGVLIHEEFYVIIKVQIFDIESDQLIYTKEIRKDGFPSEQKLLEYYPEAVAILVKMIQEAPPLPKAD